MLLTAAELAPHLKLSVGQVYRLARTKQIPAHHLGAAIRFNLEDVIAATATPPAALSPTRRRYLTHLRAVAARRTP